MIVGGIQLCVCWPGGEDQCGSETLTIDRILCQRNFSKIPHKIKEEIEEDDGSTCCAGSLCPEIYIPVWIIVFIVSFGAGLLIRKKNAAAPRTDSTVRYSPEVAELF